MTTTLLTLAVWALAAAATAWCGAMIWRALKEERLIRDRQR